MSPTMVRVACRIGRGAFEQERLFFIQQIEGSEYVGLAPTHYCYRQDETRFAAGSPQADEQEPGWVDARLVQNGGETAWVYLPTGETILVPAVSIRHLGAQTNVPVGR